VVARCGATIARHRKGCLCLLRSCLSKVSRPRIATRCQPGRWSTSARLLFDLGGEKPLHVWTIKEGGLGTAIVVEDWRIEVDPASALKVDNLHLPVGYAFNAAGEFGLVGRQAVGRGAAMPMKSDGTIYEGGVNNPRGAFQTWRIVTGPPEHPQVVVTSVDVAAPPAA
jgi:hypothetical protein